MSKVENLGIKLCGGVLALLIAGGAAVGTQRDAQPKFRDVTISAGEQLPGVDAFLTEYAVAGKCAFVTDMAALDSNAVGEHEIVLRQGAREETVTLHIEDTVSPELTVRDLEVAPDTQLKAEDFVTHLWDHSQVAVSFATEPQVPSDYRDLEVELVARDAFGNETRAAAKVSFVWMHTELTLEYGQSLTREDILFNPEKDAALITDEMLEAVNTAPLGEFSITSTSHGKTLTCKVTIQDTQGPTLELQEHQVYLYGSVKLEDFVVSATDPSGEVTLTMLTEPDCMTESHQTIVIEARDIHGNVTTAETTLYVVTDTMPPAITGVSQTLTVEKHSQPDYLAGVSATDARDGTVTVTVDDSKVDTSAAGTYFVTYIARDNSGNEATARRKVIVEHDAEDTAALVASIAAELGDDPEAIRDYVRRGIYYSSDWGGDDPVWKGFTEKHGNCYVHALCLKSILDLKGFNTQLIWVTNKTHYWLIIEMEPGVWRHIDPTPSDLHSRYSLMTDEQRLWTLSGRDWDHSQWPACE